MGSAAVLLVIGGASLVACGGDDDDVPAPTDSTIFGIPAPVDNSSLNQGPPNSAEQSPGGSTPGATVADSVVANTGEAP
ncbi:MAG: hypothetical protein AB7L17_09180 [Ilumatobacteraceae bacterium]